MLLLSILEQLNDAERVVPGDELEKFQALLEGTFHG